MFFICGLEGKVDGYSTTVFFSHHFYLNVDSRCLCERVLHLTRGDLYD